MYKVFCWALLSVVAFALAAMLWTQIPSESEGAEIERIVNHFYLALDDSAGYNSARAHAEALRTMGVERGDDVLEARGLVRLAFTELEFGKWRNEWQKKLARAESILKDDDSIAKAEYLIFAGYMDGNWHGKLEDGVSSILAGMKLAQANRADLTVLISQLLASRLLVYQRNEQEAIRLSMLANTIADHLEDERFKAMALRRAIQIFSSSGLDEFAVDFAYQLKSLAPNNCESAEKLLFHARESDDYLAIYENKVHAFLIREPVTGMDWADRAKKLYSLAMMYRTAGKIELAVETFMTVPECYANAGSARQCAAAYVRLAMLQVESGDFDSAWLTLQEILDVEDEYIENSPEELNYIFDTLGDKRRATHWARFIHSDQAGFKQKSIELMKQLNETSWGAEVKSRALEEKIQLSSQQLQSRNWFALLLLGVGLCLTGLAWFRLTVLRQTKIELERIVEDRTREIRSALESAELAAKSKSEFLARANHEIRSPLQAIVGYSELLQAPIPLGPEQKQGFLDGILASSDHLMKLVNDVIEVTRIEDGLIQTKTRSFDLLDVVSNVHQILGETAKAKGNQLVVNIDECELANLSGDDTAFKQILINLVGNAIKFTKDGRVALTVRSSQSNNKVIVEAIIEDDGEGIAAEYHDQIFQPFAELPSSDPGKGLGLYITYSLVNAMGGDINFESRLGEGTRFTLNLPFEMSKVATNINLAGDDSGPLKILIIDDKKAIRDLVCIQLKQLSHQARSCHTLEDAISLTGEWQPDLILLDLRMPGNSGFEFLKELGSYFETLPIVVAMTGDATSEVREAANLAGFDGFLPKPFQKSQLKRLFQELLEGSSKSSSSIETTEAT